MSEGLDSLKTPFVGSDAGAMKLKRKNIAGLVIFLGIGLCATAAASVYLAKLYLRAVEKERSIAQKIQNDLEREVSAIAPPPEARLVRHGTLPGVISLSYKTDLTYQEIKMFYGKELTEHGWKYLEESSLPYDGRDSGGMELVYCKGGYAADIQYAGGEEELFGWRYAFSLSSGLQTECE